MADQKYKVIERLDSGGMAEVFRGVAESLQGFKKSVAIKRILPNLTRKPKFVQMFLDEARLSLHLQHANVVQVFDIGVSDNTYFIVMEYIDGANLRLIQDSLRRQGRRLKIEHAIYLMMEVCKGLAYAHDMQDPETGKPLGIVHRDISPPNILVSRQGEVKLVDFGLAKATSQLENTEPGVVKGKFSYLSPEAAEGNEVDHRSDIFATGILLFETITGRRLFYGDNDYETVQLVRQARIPSIAALNPDVEPALEEVMRKALAREVTNRYQHAADLQDALAQYLFSRGMKVTSVDIAHLVQNCLREKERSAPPKAKTSNIIDALIQEEIVKFTSIGDEGEVDGAAPEGSRPLTPEEMSGPQAGAAGGGEDLIDPRSWGFDEREGSKPSAPGIPRLIADAQADKKAAGARKQKDKAARAKEKPAAPPPRVATPASPPSAPPAARAPEKAPRKTPPPRVAVPIGAPQRSDDLLAQMAGPGEVEAAAGRPLDPSAPPPAPRRVGIYVAIVVLLVLVGVVLALAVKVGLIGGGPRPPA